MSCELNIKQIREILHHRYPFLLIDRVTQLERGKYAEGYKNITANEELFNGHFPDNPIFPGVLILESMAQISAILGDATLKAEESSRVYYTLLAGIDKARFRKPAMPGDRINLSTELIKRRRNIWKFKCCAKLDDAVCAEAELICSPSYNK